MIKIMIADNGNNRFHTFKKHPRFIFLGLVLFSTQVYASFIETTIGTAVVNDATASYYNPAALMLMKNSQIIPQGTVASFRTHFTGQSTPLATGIAQTGVSNSTTTYYSPSLYLGMPATERITLGLAIVTNTATRNSDESSILRYVQASNRIEDYDVVPALSIKVNDLFSVGAGINFSYANFHLQPITGFPGSNSADTQSNNECDGTGIGGNVGFLLKPGRATVIGFNYRSPTVYHLSGQSNFEGPPQVTSSNYHFALRSPARSVFSINHFFTEKLGMIATIMRIQWNSLRNLHVYGIANVSGVTPVIGNVSVPFYLRDTWLFTLGSHYRITPKWILRVAGSYNESPGNTHYQIANGNSIILGASMGYELNKKLTMDGSYAHAFINNVNIGITGPQYLISGTNTASRDAVSLRLIFNL